MRFAGTTRWLCFLGFAKCRELSCARIEDRRKMSRQRPIGPCKLCGAVGPLTDEHIPPKGSLPSKKYSVEVQSGDAYFLGGPARPYQRGFHQPALCERCNKLTGARYGREFSAWSKWGHQLLEEMRRELPRRVDPYIGYPARIAKQVVATMIAASQSSLTDSRPDLRMFVLDPNSHLTRGQLRLATYLCPTHTGRSTGVATAMKVGQTPHVLVEFALPPFGYVLTLDGQPIDNRPVDIGWFATCGFEEQREITLSHIPVLPTHEGFPGDYRTKDEIRRDVIENFLSQEGHPRARDEAARIFAVGGGPGFFAAHGEEW